LGFWNFHHHSPKGQPSELSKEEQPNTPESSWTNPNNEEPAKQTQTTKDSESPLNNVMLSFWKKNQSPPNREDLVPSEEDDSGVLAFPLPTEETTKSDDEVVSIDDDDDDEVVEISESDEDGTMGNSSTTPGISSKASSSPNKQAADKFKSSMKNMGKLFAFR
jgi:hypothetical protein